MEGNRLPSFITVLSVILLFTGGCREAEPVPEVVADTVVVDDTVAKKPVPDSAEGARRDSMRQWLQSDGYREEQKMKAKPLEYIEIVKVDQEISEGGSVVELHSTVKNSGVRQLRDLHLEFALVDSDGEHIAVKDKAFDVVINPGETRKLRPLKLILTSRQTKEKLESVKIASVKVNKLNGTFRAMSSDKK